MIILYYTDLQVIKPSIEKIKRKNIDFFARNVCQFKKSSYLCIRNRETKTASRAQSRNAKQRMARSSIG